MAYLKQRLSEATRYSNTPIDIVDPETQGLRGDWGAYLAGFVSAEGYFGINPRGSVRPRLAVRLRADDLGLLQAIHERTGCGRVYGPREQAGSSPVVAWIVVSRQDLFDLVAALDRIPPKGRKLREYEIWREAALLAQLDTSPALRVAMAEAGQRLKVVRRFAPRIT